MSIVQMFAGPNGSGKSTITNGIPRVGIHINADEIKKKLGCSDLEAAQNATKMREYCLDNQQDFTMETVLSSPRNVNLLIRAKKQGYYIIGHFILTNHPDINVSRVAQRVKNGGHDVDEDLIRSRYRKSLDNLTQLPDLCNELYVYDNSLDRTQGDPELIAKSFYGTVELFPSPVWPLDRLQALMTGQYYTIYIQPDTP